MGAPMRLSGGAGLIAILLAMPASVAAAGVDSYYSKTFNACMNDAGGSTMPMRDCLAAEHDAWDKSLNETYRGLIASRTGGDKLKLRDEERAWLKATAHKCDHAGDDEAGGSLQGVEVDQCYLDETIRRTVYLRGVR